MTAYRQRGWAIVDKPRPRSGDVIYTNGRTDTGPCCAPLLIYYNVGCAAVHQCKPPRRSLCPLADRAQCALPGPTANQVLAIIYRLRLHVYVRSNCIRRWLNAGTCFDGFTFCIVAGRSTWRISKNDVCCCVDFARYFLVFSLMTSGYF